MAGKLDQPLLATRDVLDFVTSPDGRAVLYRTNALGQNQLDLFLVPIEGLQPAVMSEDGVSRKGKRLRLSQFSPGRQVGPDYAFGADGTQVLFRANRPASTARFDLYGVPADGSSLPLQLSDPQAGDRTVGSFALDPDESRAVYVSDAVTDEVFELFSVPLAGGPAARLAPLPAFADVSSFRIAPRARVVYMADRNADGVLELFAVPIDGSAPAERLNATLPAGGDVESDYVPLAGRTLYRADQGTNDVVELFVSREMHVLPR